MSDETMMNPTVDGPAAEGWRSMYLVQRRRARMLMATTAIALLALAGTVAWAVTKPGADPVAARPGIEGLVPGSGEGPGGGFLARGGVERYFDEDGSLSTEQVEQTLSRFEGLGGVPEGFAARIAGAVDAAVGSGSITAGQGDALLGALGIDGGAGDA
jgi:hypothetical protein